ncbi:plasmid mobilization protein [Clostridium sp.]|jgi:hypothetical protein|uniref:plasmid mobilization protein n=1 Tax=Clostridium sp. TaxID=1506 RepID=UPI003FD837F3
MNRTRPKQILIRVSELELNAIKLKVTESKINQNEYILRCLLDKEIVVIDGLKEQMVEVRRIGNNLNQLTRAVNEGRTNCGEELKDINQELKKVWQLLRLQIQRQH